MIAAGNILRTDLAAVPHRLASVPCVNFSCGLPTRPSSTLSAKRTVRPETIASRLGALLDRNRQHSRPAWRRPAARRRLTRLAGAGAPAVLRDRGTALLPCPAARALWRRARVPVVSPRVHRLPRHRGRSARISRVPRASAHRSLRISSRGKRLLSVDGSGLRRWCVRATGLCTSLRACLCKLGCVGLSGEQCPVSPVRAVRRVFLSRNGERMSLPAERTGTHASGKMYFFRSPTSPHSFAKYFDEISMSWQQTRCAVTPRRRV